MGTAVDESMYTAESVYCSSVIAALFLRTSHPEISLNNTACIKLLGSVCSALQRMSHCCMFYGRKKKYRRIKLSYFVKVIQMCWRVSVPNMKQSLLEENMHRLDLLIHAIHKLNWLQMWCVSRDNIKHILSIYKGLPHFNLT